MIRCLQRALPALLLAAPLQAQSGFVDRSVSLAGRDHPYQVYVPRDYTADRAWPVILFLHGAGERGSDGLRQTAVGLAPAIRLAPSRWPAIVVLPQAPLDSTWTGRPADAAMAALDATLREYRTDPARVYLTGLSMGGNGSWYLAYRHASRFAAVAPVCGWVAGRNGMGEQPVVPPEDGEPFEALAGRLRGLPVWIFHGEMDPVVPAEQSRRAAAALEAAGVDVRYTELPGVGHNSWDAAYGSSGFAEWLFAQRKQ